MSLFRDPRTARTAVLQAVIAAVLCTATIMALWTVLSWRYGD